MPHRTGNADGREVVRAVEDVGGAVGDGASDGDCFVIGIDLADPMPGGIDGGFRRAIYVEEAARRLVGENRSDGFGIARFAAEKHVF